MREIGPLLLGVAASAATMIGGLTALQMRSRPGLIAGLSAGIVIGVALFDLLPEALTPAPPEVGPRYVLTGVAVGLGLYLMLTRLPKALLSDGEWLRRQITPATLTIHSIVDGLGIGLGFQLSSAVGWSIAFAVLSHDIADGVNIVSVNLDGDDDRWGHR